MTGYETRAAGHEYGAGRFGRHAKLPLGGITCSNSTVTSRGRRQMKAFTFATIAALSFLSLTAGLGAAEKPLPPDVHCDPVAERGDRKLGCFVTGSELLGELPKTPLYWHLYEYPSRAAADSARSKQGSV